MGPNTRPRGIRHATRRGKHRELRAAQPLALIQKEEKNFRIWHGPHVTSPIAPALAVLWARMTLARHEPCQLLNHIVPQALLRCWTRTIRLPYGVDTVRKHPRSTKTPDPVLSILRRLAEKEPIRQRLPLPGHGYCMDACRVPSAPQPQGSCQLGQGLLAVRTELW
jgi:hypothetical protein